MTDPEIVRAWIRIVRDLVIVAVATFILVHETVTSRDPNPTLVGAGLVLLGIPPALRADEWLRRRDRNGDGSSS